ncbi:aspartate 1-decarboxylase [Halieaceae bacterium IMCC14734]|uniref:Aspartate 1-decarboxylase n=1 Tax=Candidatus Litorirhabdus singularis TaxID=2518993 RepID=A0ABT3TD15_9GAMM|nr:aspartate 1-decarboxylase [Candidatus Litorirhabdus singularis]MCX2979879.1 aspartate 1-decarboxylase [Candidatus Litorirhabdus singularis]
MLIEKLKAKIHRATVTDANLNYVGSITIDSDLLTASGIQEYEKVQVVNITNGQRFETYVITGESGAGGICLNGACARLAEVDDKVIIMAYCQLDAEENATFTPTLVFVNDNNEAVDEATLV